jgi:hypothetical protein
MTRTYMYDGTAFLYSHIMASSKNLAFCRYKACANWHTSLFSALLCFFYSGDEAGVTFHLVKRANAKKYKVKVQIVWNWRCPFRLSAADEAKAVRHRRADELNRRNGITLPKVKINNITQLRGV